jgi:hypothetical protein
MKKLFVLMTALAATTLFVQANDMEKMEATVEKVMQEAVESASQPQTDITPAPGQEENHTKKETAEALPKTTPDKK